MIACTRDCYDTCIFTPVYRDGELIRLKPLEGPPTFGFTCARGAGDVKRLKAPNRVKTPLLRGERQVVEVSWERVLREVAERMASEEPHRVLHIDYDGNQGLLTWYYPARLFNAMGAASTDYSICSSEGREAIKLHWGRAYGAMPEDFSKRPVIFWAIDAAVSFIHGWTLAKKSGNRLAAVDVWMSTTMKNVDLPILIKPATDVVLALGVAREIIQRYNVEGGRGFREFVKHVERYTPTYVSRETGVSPSQLEELVEFYLAKPLSVIGMALSRIENGGDAARAISLLHALLGDPGGFFYSNSEAWGIDFRYLRGLHMASPSRVVPMGLVGSAIGDFRFVYVWNANPVLTLPQGDRIATAAARGDITLVVHTPFMDETAQAAHLVLPAPTYLEKEDVVYSYWHNYLIYNTPVANPPAGSRPEVWVVAKLAEVLGLDHPLLREDPWVAVEVALRNTGITLSELKARRVVPLSKPNVGVGEVEFYSTAALERGLPPLPQYKPPAGRFVLTFPPSPLYTNSQFREVYGEPPPKVKMNPADYVSRCVVLYNEFGQVEVEAEADPDVPPGVVIYVGVGRDKLGRPINAIVRGDPGLYGGTPKLYTTYVEVAPC